MRTAAAINRQYALFLGALVGAYAPTLAANDAAARRHADTRAVALAAQFRALVAAEIAAAPAALVTPFLTRLDAIVARNLTDAGRHGAATKLLAGQMTRAAGGFGTLLQRRFAAPRFVATDAAGRRWDAPKLVAVLARDLDYQAGIAATLSAIVAAGGDLAEVVYPDPQHAHAGLVFSITGATPGVPRLDQISATVFHVNATAGVRRHV